MDDLMTNIQSQKEIELEKRERELLDLGKWIGQKMDYHKKASFGSVLRKQINQGEVWGCDLGYNIGQEKNKHRMVVVVSNNSLNTMGKVTVVPITDAKNKVDVQLRLPYKINNYLLYTNSTNSRNWYDFNRTVPAAANQYSWLTKDSVIQCEEPRSVSKARFAGQKKGDLNATDFKGLQKKIADVFGIQIAEENN